MVTTTAASSPIALPTTPTQAATRARLAGALGVGVFVLALAVARGFVRFRGDVTFDDEIGYLSGGLDLARGGLPPASWSPLYVLWYRLLAFFTRDVIALFHLSWTGLVGLNLGAMAAALWRAGARTTGILIAIATVSVLGVLTPPIASVSLLASAVFLAGVVLALGADDLRTALARLLLGGVVGAFVRPELAVAAGAGAALWAAAAVWTRAGWVTAARELGPAVVVGAALVALLGNPLAGGRSFFAFSQHYALNAAEARRLPESGWEEYRAITQAAFGSARTVGEAMRANPREFAWHLGRNAARLGTLRSVLEPSLDLPAKIAHAVSGVLTAVVSLGLVLAALRARRRSEDGRAGRILALAVGIAAVPAITSMLLVQPEPSYALPLLLPVLSLSAWGLCVAPRGRSAGRTRPQAVPARRAAAIAAGFALVAALPGRGGAPWWRARGPAGGNPNTALVRYLARLPLDVGTPVTVMGYWGLGAFARWSSRPVSYVDCSPFDDCVRQRRVDVVILDPGITAYYARHGDRPFAAFRSAPDGWGFVKSIAPEPSGAEVFVRSDRLIAAPR